MEHMTTKKASSTTAKTALGLGIGALGIQALGGGGGVLGNLFGGTRVNEAPSVTFAPQAVFNAEQFALQGGYVTGKELSLVREIGAKDSEIAALKAEKYTDAAVNAATKPLEIRICEAEKQLAVNAARDYDFRRYADSEYVHQPKACMREQLVVTKSCGCDCDH